jgi:hypothetical protein
VWVRFLQITKCSMIFDMDRRMIKTVQTALLILFVSFPCLSQAESPLANCPDLYQVGRSCFDEIKNPRPGILPQKHRNIMGFVLGRDSFESAQRLFGKVNAWHSGDASTSEDKVCYFIGDGEQQIVMVFASNSEMSKGDVDEVRFLKGNVAFLDKCSKIRLPSKKLQTESGLYVGMSVKKMKDILGRPTEEKMELIVYSFSDEKELKPEDPLYSYCKVDGKSTAQQCSGISAGVAHGLVEWLVIWFGAGYVC